MKNITLKDLYTQKEIQELKEKIPQLSNYEQRRIRLHLEEIVFKAICEKFPDMRKKPNCNKDILQKELGFLYSY